MSRNLFLRIVDGVEKAAGDNFTLRKYCSKHLSFSPQQKCTGALRMLAYGKAADAIDVETHYGEGVRTRVPERAKCGGHGKIIGNWISKRIPTYVRFN